MSLLRKYQILNGLDTIINAQELVSHRVKKEIFYTEVVLLNSNVLNRIVSNIISIKNSII